MGAVRPDGRSLPRRRSAGRRAKLGHAPPDGRLARAPLAGTDATTPQRGRFGASPLPFVGRGGPGPRKTPEMTDDGTRMEMEARCLSGSELDASDADALDRRAVVEHGRQQVASSGRRGTRHRVESIRPSMPSGWLGARVLLRGGDRMRQSRSSPAVEARVRRAWRCGLFLAGSSHGSATSPVWSPERVGWAVSSRRS